MRKTIVILSLVSAVVAALLVSLSGCEKKDIREVAPAAAQRALPFNHKVHVVGEKMKCRVCHKTAEKEELAGFPTFASCNKCHKGLDEKKPVEKRIATNYVEGKTQWSYVTESKTIAPDQIKFSHKIHFDAKVQCTTCHRGVEVAKDIVPAKLHTTMFECIACHVKTHVGDNVSNECKICHTQIDKKFEPQNHFVNWKQLHGREAGFLKKESQASCGLCHTEASCVACHRVEAPANHTNFWRERGHGVSADMDRAQCKVCHTEDSCLRCHQTIQPQNHRGNFSATHCTKCHFPLKEEGCIACHKNANSHLQAARLPMNLIHKQATDATCRDCHNGLKMLPHQDDGGSCLMCHRR
ncbi:MAG TPA: cytochrome c3 family protein [Planctomycetota bacterium]|nr:cytochrome c3 family protein [Planctomycetota bacterium]